jgi:hypothetical protein
LRNSLDVEAGAGAGLPHLKLKHRTGKDNQSTFVPSPSPYHLTAFLLSSYVRTPFTMPLETRKIPKFNQDRTLNKKMLKNKVNFL